MKTKHDISQLFLVEMSWRTRHGQTGFDDESQTPGHSEAEEELGRGPGFSRTMRVSSEAYFPDSQHSEWVPRVIIS